MIFRKTHPLIALINNILIDLPTPSNSSYIWNFGSLLGICLINQILTGFFLAIYYNNTLLEAFSSISHINRDVINGWLIRSLHANGASLFFFLIFPHIGRGIYYSRFFFIPVWFSGVLILLILIGTAFLGYVLPWGQISFWGATVITNLLTAIPYIGKIITLWIWGSFSVDHITLTRFFSLHFLLPFLLLAIILIHIIFLHETGSNNPLGSSLNIDKIQFHPYFSFKDILGFIIILLLFLRFRILSPYFFIDPENFIPANALVTPPHIQPEWYFLFAYAILRRIPNKLGGVIALFCRILILLILPFSIKNKFKPFWMNPVNKLIFWILVVTFLLLTFLGSCPVNEPYVLIRQIFRFIYFLIFFIIRYFS